MFADGFSDLKCRPDELRRWLSRSPAAGEAVLPVDPASSRPLGTNASRYNSYAMQKPSRAERAPLHVLRPPAITASENILPARRRTASILSTWKELPDVKEGNHASRSCVPRRACRDD